MDWVETTGRTVDEAKRSALEQLGVEESDAEFEVVAEARVGLFGRLKEEARVRARLQPRYPRSKGERRERRHGRTAGAGQPGRTRPAAGQSADRPETAAGEQEPLGEAARPSTSRRRRRGTKGHSSASQLEPVGSQPATRDASLEEVSREDLQEQARLAEAFLLGLLERLGASGSVNAEVQEEGLVDVNVTGEGLGILIGPRGTTLLALQEITRTVVQRHVHAAESRVVVDVNGYRKRRHEALARFARQVAQEVAASKTKRALEPMPAADRKVVHDAVNAIAGVTTVSEGEEPNRRVVLVPSTAETGPSSSLEQAGLLEGEELTTGETTRVPNAENDARDVTTSPDVPGQKVPS